MIIPPYVATYATQNPYITASEFINSPTGVDVNQLNPGAGNLSQTQTLNNLIRRASGWADSLCNQKLSATLDTQAGLYLVRKGALRVPLDFTPIVAVSQIKTGWSPSSMEVMTQTADVWIGANVVTVPVTSMSASGMGYMVGGLLPDRMYCTIEYVNGWADTQVSTGIAAGDVSLTIGSALGINPGQSLTLYDGTMGETVTVDAAYIPSTTPGTATIPLAAPVGNSYVAGATLTAMPQEIKQAVIALTCVLIKTRGSEALVMSSIHGNPSTTTKLEDDANDDFMIAADLLAPFKRVM